MGIAALTIRIKKKLGEHISPHVMMTLKLLWGSNLGLIAFGTRDCN
jgi:hypothetical protein